MALAPRFPTRWRPRRRRPPWRRCQAREDGARRGLAPGPLPRHERPEPHVEGPEQTGDGDRRRAIRQQAPRKGAGVRSVRRSETAEAAAVDGRAQRSASGAGHRSEARQASSHQEADRAPGLALLTDTVPGDDRPSTGQGGVQHLQELPAVDRTSVELEVHRYVLRDRGRAPEGGDVLGVGVDGRAVLTLGGEIDQALDSPCGGAGADGNQAARGSSHLEDALGGFGRGDRTLDQRHVVRPGLRRSRHLAEVDNPNSFRQGEQLVLTIEQAQLAPIARGELPHRQGGALLSGTRRGHRDRHHRSRSLSSSATTPE